VCACYAEGSLLTRPASVPDPQFAIVRARHEELPVVRELAGRIWRAHYPGIISHEQIAYMLERGYAPDALAEFLDVPERGLELATVDGELAGFAAWYVTDNPDEAKLDKLYVQQSRQRQGIGGRLIAHVSSLASVAGARLLVLNVNKQNAQAIRGYEKHGFAVREAVVVDIGRGYVMDDYVMVKPI
jgi:ribosomal protein S18 acetylase RimI-like enzyme